MADGLHTEPTPLERERAMGLSDNCTALPGASPLLRHQVLGRCVDLNAASAIFGIAKAWSVCDKRGTVVENEAVEEQVLMSTVSTSVYEQMMMSSVADAEASQDIWHDDTVLYYLRSGEWPEGIEPLEKSRAAKRLR